MTFLSFEEIAISGICVCVPKEGIQEIMNDVFDLVEQARDSGGSEAAFRVVLEKLRSEKKYPLVFEARLMQKRHKLGLPLIHPHQIVWIANGREFGGHR